MASKTTWRNYANKGDGVHFPFGEPSDPEKERMQIVIDLNERWKRHKGNRSKAGLYRLAKRYERLKCPMMAALVRADARSL